MTNGWTDVANADVILVMGGNPAENHPVGFRFAMQARLERDARMVCVDPRFNRTAAVSDLYVPIRAGTDIAFLGGLIHWALEHGNYHADYVRAHTNAPFLVHEGFGFADGHFSGWDTGAGTYDRSTWSYEMGADGYARVDPTLQHERSVFQHMRRHFARYTPERVAGICGCSAAEFEAAAEVITSTGTAGRAGTILYALGWTQHSHSVQLIHAAAMLQLLLGNVGIPGGGVNAQRGHSNIQGATDMGAWNMLPGYLKMPRAGQQRLRDYLADNTPRPLRPDAMNYWSRTPQFMVSLLKAYWGEAAGPDNDHGYHWLPKVAEGADHSWGSIFDDMAAGRMQGLISFGMNPVANGPNSRKMLRALGQLDWLIVVENFDTETASFWRARELAPDAYPDAPVPADIGTEVFLLPAGCFAEKDGTFVNSSRWLQWKEAALPPPGEARNDQEIIARLLLAVRDLYASEGGANPEPLLLMNWDYGNRTCPDLAEVAREINGQAVIDGAQLDGFGQLRDDGTTRCGNWLYSGSYTAAGNRMARRGLEDTTGLGLYPEYAWSWPANRRVLYNRAGLDAEGRPWDEARAPIRWQGGRWHGDVPDYRADAAPTEFSAFIMLPEGVARLFAPELVEGPFPEHYEPAESPVDNPLHAAVSSNPLARVLHGQDDALGTAAEFPYVAITYRLTEHFHYWTKHVASATMLQPGFFVEVPAALAADKGIATGDAVSVRSARGEVRGPALVTTRIRPLLVAGRTVYQVGLPIHWGFLGRVTGPLVNNLTPSVLDPNSGTPEYKGFLVDLQRVEA